jgi:hypothetical protein
MTTLRDALEGTLPKTTNGWWAHPHRFPYVLTILISTRNFIPSLNKEKGKASIGQLQHIATTKKNRKAKFILTLH